MLDLLTHMVRIRNFEAKCAQLYTLEKIRGFLHLYDGEEAVAVGVIPALNAQDAVVATYREHGHALARGVPMPAVLAEMYGKQEGCSRGRGGSMHLFHAATNFYGGNAIVGGGLPMAVGLALAAKLRGEDRVIACFFGEGAVAEGEFHESMNLAELWRLPVLFVCENNLYAMGTALAISESEVDIHHKARSYNMPAAAVDGMDVVAVEVATRRALAFIREGGGPSFLECRTYRFRAHSTLEDARGMLWSALADPDPVLIFEHVMLYNMAGELDPAAGAVPIDKAAVRRAGADVSLITYGGSLFKTLAAAQALADQGVTAEVIDLRTLRPLDDATIIASVTKTHRAVIVDEGWRSGSIAAEVSARIKEQAFWSLDAPVGRVCSAEVPIPYAKHLETAALPQLEQIVAAALAALGRA